MELKLFHQMSSNRMYKIKIDIREVKGKKYCEVKALTTNRRMRLEYQARINPKYLSNVVAEGVRDHLDKFQREIYATNKKR